MPGETNGEGAYVGLAADNVGSDFTSNGVFHGGLGRGHGVVYMCLKQISNQVSN
jgi:hypothetical protein